MTYTQVKTVTGLHYETNEPIKVSWENGTITQIQRLDDADEDLPTIAPGFVDLQINGYMGIDFNHKPMTEKAWVTIMEGLAKAGVTSFQPTMITNSFEQLARNFKAAEETLNNIPDYSSFVEGYHLEGPYLSKENGPRGAHNLEFIKAPNWEEFLRLQDAANGKIKLLTLSPEWEQSETFIKKVVDTGVKVAIGHTAADTAQIEKAVAAGASLSTHLGNGAHVNLPRHPNYLWDQLSQEGLYASVIADGHHLPQNVLNVFHKVKQEKMFLISDSVALAGMAPGDYQAGVGGEVTLTENGRLHLKNEAKLLAGSAQNIWQGVQYLVEEKICSFSEAINKASIIPRNYMNGRSEKDLTTGSSATLVLINRNTNTIEQTIKNGKTVYKAGV
jgi:N-acetylglucosamine-6-phosphate deacetylase